MIRQLCTASLLLVTPLTASAAMITFQDDVSPTVAYTGTADTELRNGVNSSTNFGTATTTAPNSDGSRQMLLRFDSVFGNGVNQIPLGSTINSATLTVTRGGGSGTPTFAVYRALMSWNEGTSTWDNSFGGSGIQTNGTEAASTPDSSWTGTWSGSATASFNVATTLQSWSDGGTNNGWALLATSASGTIKTAENASGHPSLAITYTVPEPASLALLGLGGLLLARRRRV